ncbi:MAG: hypothetical protein KME20_06210 [Kaiparowitsia implicata GSE-PSE-MK54-09C]|jgi:hypothetical protein|nr:hypothetical protein [Kaiparowitsia implicata GSE-PSE-MK54-09C]
MAIITGMGNFGFLTNGLTIERFLPLEPMEFEMAGEAESQTSQKWVAGRRVTAGTGISSETYNLTIGIEAANWLSMQMAVGEFAGTTASVNLPNTKFATIPAESPYEITDPDIANATIYVSDLQGRQFTQESGAPDAAYEFQYVPGPPKKLLFNSTEAGKDIAYRYLKAETNLPSIGKETVATTIRNLSFHGVAYGDEELIEIVIPNMGLSGIPSISFNDVTKFDLEFELVVQAGARRQFEMYRLPLPS